MNVRSTLTLVGSDRRRAIAELGMGDADAADAAIAAATSEFN